ncbi:Tripartite-type tricarboxylate transporter, receptor component TctC [Variovorax sp. HW608]|uniref:Bug family tripartite tricarboxylate transporter substrate binding protein n=1 Tax=Variovorax sp. HW608 TaxID=1034889 RepID=UPI00081F935B|nr:tripartite tricarboxylate transporter substrate binding protein [Variovorax sp. HW608]SCK32549.1 Tripartite-type tricarboxylate transporter, receptor component TctC [Variovorax sp. HW608]
MERIVSILIALVALLSSSLVSAQAYPTKPIRIIVPYQAGQGTDVATRYLAEHLGRGLGQPLVIENRAGAGGNIGAAEVARAAPDGYTLLMGTNGTHVLNQFLYPSIPFDPEKDFEPVALVSTFPMVILANPNAPYKNMADLLADAKARPDVVNVGLPSTTSRLVLELIQKQSGVVMRSVPYKGSGTSMTDLMGGQVLVGIDTASAARPFVANGKLKALAVTSLKDSALLPGARPAASQGLEGFEVVAWNGLYAPHGTPAAIVQKLNAEIVKILALPEARQRLLELGHETAGGTPDGLDRFARSEREKWGPLIKSVGMKLE